MQSSSPAIGRAALVALVIIGLTACADTTGVARPPADTPTATPPAAPPAAPTDTTTDTPADTTGATRPPAGVGGISVQADSLVLEPGSGTTLDVTVDSARADMRLGLEGVPAGVGAWFSPQQLRPGDRTSTLRIIAYSTALPAESTITIVALSSDSALAATPLAKTTLRVRIAAATCVGDTVADTCSGFPIGDGGIVEGVVREWTPTGMRPAAGVYVFAWVQLRKLGYSFGFVTNHPIVLTDANGAYRFEGMPAAYVLLQATGSGLDQPCGTFMSFAGPRAVADLVVARQSVGAPLPDLTAPALTGVVYETIDGARRPLAGARVYLEWRDVVAATTTTDAEGRYALCGLPTWGDMATTPVLAGYRTTTRTVTLDGIVRMDLEMMRE